MSAVPVSRAAELLGVSRTAVVGWLDDDDHPLRSADLDGRRGVDSASIVVVLERQRREHGQVLRRIADALSALGASTDDDAEPVSLPEALVQERIGRATAEARIDQLRADLLRVNAAVAALLPQPDANADEVVARSMPT